MKLTQNLKQALVCAGITALSVAAYGTTWVAEDFEAHGSGLPQSGDGITTYLAPNWLPVFGSGVDQSTFEPSDLARLAFSACNTPMVEKVPYLDDFVMALNTEGATLERVLPSPGINFENTPIYVDMMVKFVLSEDQPDMPDRAVKALIYANANSNLVVWAGDGVDGYFTELERQVNPEQWYRLTLTWVYWSEAWTSMFSIQVNGGEPVTSMFGWTEEWAQPGPWFMSAHSNVSDTDLTAIQFEGTGFIDELVVTDVKPDIILGGETLFADTGDPVDETDYDNWKTANGTSIGLAGGVQLWMYEAYLMNVDPGISGTSAKLKIASIVPTLTGADITVVAAVEGKADAPVSAPIGNLIVEETPSLDQAFNTTSFLIVGGGVYSVPGDPAKNFFKARIEPIPVQ